MGRIIDVFKSRFLLILTSFIWVNNGSVNAAADYPNPFAPAAGIGTSIQPAGASNLPNPIGQAAGNPNLPASGPTGCPPSPNTNVAVCPASDNNVYFTTDGTFFKIQCARQHGTATIQTTTAQSFQQCIDKCGQEPTCNSVNYVTASSGCSLLSSTGAATDAEASANQNYAYKIDPPTQPAKNENLVACSTSCPSGNGQSYSSIFGETFRITCGKRHGTEYLKIDKQATLKDCMDSCASYIPCHSVDYNDRSRTCYYSNHQGEPTIVTSGFSSAYSLGCTSSCCANTTSSCGGCGGCTSCSPCVPPKPLGPPMPDLSCGNQGLQYAIYGNNPDGSINTFGGAGYPSFGADIFKTAPLQYSGTTSSIGLTASSPIYGNVPANPGYVAVNHRAYIFAQQSGVYTFSLPYVDDITLLWVGPAAYSGYTRSNANIVQTYVTGAQTPITYTITFQQGNYYPLRVLWANGGGAGAFGLKLTGPDGKVILGPETKDPSPFLVQYSCDETTAPRFPPFGSET